MSEPVLAYYDVNKPTLISVDASSYGIGGVLMQQNGVWKTKCILFKDIDIH